MGLFLTRWLILFLIVTLGDCSERNFLNRKTTLSRGSDAPYTTHSVGRYEGRQPQSSQLIVPRDYPSSNSHSLPIKEGEAGDTKKAWPRLVPVTTRQGPQSRRRRVQHTKSRCTTDEKEKSASKDSRPTERAPILWKKKGKREPRTNFSSVEDVDSVSLALGGLTLRETDAMPSESKVSTFHDKEESSRWENEDLLNSLEETSNLAEATRELREIIKKGKLEAEANMPPSEEIRPPSPEKVKLLPLEAHIKLLSQGMYDNRGVFYPELRLFVVSGRDISIFASCHGRIIPLYIPISNGGVPITVDATGLLLCRGFFTKPYEVMRLLMDLPAIFARNSGEAATLLRQFNCYYYGAQYTRPLPLRAWNSKGLSIE